jgi:transglutaminase-like putative cysteine protease
MAKYRVVHNNYYSFAEAVSHCTLEARLKPLDNKKQSVEFSQFVSRPLVRSQSNSHDEFGNHVHYFELSGRLQSFLLSAIHTVATWPLAAIEPAASSPWEQMAGMAAKDALLQTFHADRKSLTEYNQDISAYASLSFQPDRPILDGAYDLMQRIHSDFQYDSVATMVDTSAINAFRLRRGVCQDFTHIAIACLHSLDLPARYVSGYVDTKIASERPHRVAADVSHAWFSVYDVKHGWVDFDATNNSMPGETYITLAYGRDYRDITPLKGQTDSGGQNRLKVDVDLTALS